MKYFDIPIVLFSFIREDKILQIIDRISVVKPTKIYLLSDGGRDEAEHDKVVKCREKIEERINWDCEIIKKYASKNIGVFENIAGGARWVFEKEEYAIFLEDDNLPAITFFQFCKELLEKYKDNQQVLWICGTNYLKEYIPKDETSYVFTRNMLPCGWASWSEKFLKYYDDHFSLWDEEYINENISKDYLYKQLFKQDYSNWKNEIENKIRFGKYVSWDYQMSWSIRVHKLYGIVPKYNQIKNIGVDPYSIHGGTTMDNIMTKRFCYIETKELEFPLKHSGSISIDKEFEIKTAKIITYPLRMRIKIRIISFLKKIFKIDKYDSLSVVLKERIF